MPVIESGHTPKPYSSLLLKVKDRDTPVVAFMEDDHSLREHWSGQFIEPCTVEWWIDCKDIFKYLDNGGATVYSWQGECK